MQSESKKGKEKERLLNSKIVKLPKVEGGRIINESSTHANMKSRDLKSKFVTPNSS